MKKQFLCLVCLLCVPVLSCFAPPKLQHGTWHKERGGQPELMSVSDFAALSSMLSGGGELPQIHKLTVEEHRVKEGRKTTFFQRTMEARIGKKVIESVYYYLSLGEEEEEEEETK